MKKIIIGLLMMPLVAIAAGGGMHNYKADYDLDNILSVTATDYKTRLLPTSNYGSRPI